jgi:tRNA threonylcarbamoyl adenosine modification protein (Sua5/YciO/YrdC/YwlC family)
MSEQIAIHPVDPQPRLVRRAVDCLRDGGLIAYPTDSSYAFGWSLGNRTAQDKVVKIRETDKAHNFTMVCKDLSEIANYAKVDNVAYRLLKTLTPGPYTFILPATKDVPKWLRHPKRKTIGIRVPEHPIAHALLEALGEPIMSSTLIVPGESMPITELEDFPSEHLHLMDLMVDGGHCGHEPTTVVDFTGSVPQVLRHGKGCVDFLDQI